MLKRQLRVKNEELRTEKEELRVKNEELRVMVIKLFKLNFLFLNGTHAMRSLPLGRFLI